MSIDDENNKSILPVNASQLLKDLEKTALKISDLEAKNKDVLNADKLAENLLPWLGWAFSVDSWSDNWREDVKRDMVQKTISLHQTKGTKKAIQRALDVVGVFANITEWWEMTPQGKPHTFEIDAFVNDNINPDAPVIISLEVQKRLIDLINNVKPARSHFSFKLGAKFEAKVSLGAVCRVRQFEKFSFEPDSNASFGAKISHGSVMKIRQFENFVFEPESQASFETSLAHNSFMRLQQLDNFTFET
jgi:phage tail P2-like protein